MTAKTKDYWEELKSNPVRYNEYRERAREREFKRIQKRRENPVLLMRWREYQRRYQKSHSRELKATAKEKLGGKCIHCDFKDSRALRFHHTIKLKKREDPQTMCRRILKGAEDVVLLCSICHDIHHFEEDKQKELEEFIKERAFISEDNTETEELDPIDYTIWKMRFHGETWENIAIEIGMSESIIYERGKILGLL